MIQAFDEKRKWLCRNLGRRALGIEALVVKRLLWRKCTTERNVSEGHRNRAHIEVGQSGRRHKSRKHSQLLRMFIPRYVYIIVPSIIII